MRALIVVTPGPVTFAIVMSTMGVYSGSGNAKDVSRTGVGRTCTVPLVVVEISPSTVTVPVAVAEPPRSSLTVTVNVDVPTGKSRTPDTPPLPWYPVMIPVVSLPSGPVNVATIGSLSGSTKAANS